jgi:hypothetical protein
VIETNERGFLIDIDVQDHDNTVSSTSNEIINEQGPRPQGQVCNLSTSIYTSDLSGVDEVHLLCAVPV